MYRVFDRVFNLNLIEFIAWTLWVLVLGIVIGVKYVQ